MATNINPKFQHSWQFKRRQPEEYLAGLQDSDRTLISQCISLAESTNLEDKILVNQVLKDAQGSWTDNTTIRIGITGPPGVGKSSFIELLGHYIADTQKEKLAVIAVDPSSADSKGAILGDLTRMDLLSQHQNAYVRPNANNQHLGGLTHNTATSILICEAAGFDTTLLESVGIGQSEIQIQSMTDVIILLLQPGSGDILQGIKKGVMEVADILVVNKVDGDTKQLGLDLINQLKQLYPHKTLISHSNVDSDLNCIPTILKTIPQLLNNQLSRRKNQHRNLVLEEVKAAILDHAAASNFHQDLLDRNTITDNPIDAYVKLRNSLENLKD